MWIGGDKMDIVVTQIKQIGREIMLDGNSLVGYQHSANLFIKLIKDTSETNPFKGMVLSGFCSSWKSDMPIVCPLQEKDEGTYILLPDGVFENEGDVYLSLAAIDENKIVITSNKLALQVDASNKIVSSTNPSEKYWEIEVLNAMKAWYANVVDPVFIASNEKLNQLIRRTEEHEEKAEELQQNAQTQQNQVAAAIGDAEQATQAANTAAANADEKATAANTAAQAANKAKDDADTATGKANKAASDANTAASNANTKAGEAATATTAATQAADSANTKVQEIQQKLNNGDFNGRTTYNGNGEPAVVLGKDGDTYLNKSNEGQHPKWLYLKEGGKWTPLWNTQGIDGTDTVPVGAGYLISGDTVPPGYKEVTPPFSNPNQLINGDFQINQKGQIEYSVTNGDLFTLDRWRIIGANATAKLTKLDNGVRLQNADTGSVVLTQRIYIEKVSNYTIVINAKNVVGNVVAEIYDMGSGYKIQNLKNGRNVIKVTNQSLKDITPTIVGAGSIEIEYVDLYEGDIAYQHIKEDPAIALLRCIPYYQVININTPIRYEYGNEANKYEYLLEPTFKKMRTIPTVVKCIYNYYDTAGNNVSGNCVDISVFDGYFLGRTTPGNRMQSHCYSASVNVILDAEIR